MVDLSQYDFIAYKFQSHVFKVVGGHLIDLKLRMVRHIIRGISYIQACVPLCAHFLFACLCTRVSLRKSVCACICGCVSESMCQCV